MVRRHDKAAFMAGLWVFPGGKLDTSDFDDQFLEHAREGSLEECRARLAQAHGEAPEGREAFALHVAAVRELFEEAGVLLAKPRSSLAAGAPDLDLRKWRNEIDGEQASLLDLLIAENLELDLDGMTYVSRWLTPSAEPMRFDARFFAVRLPEGQVAAADQNETTAGEWREAPSFLDSHSFGDLTLAPPNIRSLEDLARHRTIDGYLSAMTKRRVAPVLPKMVMDGRTMLVLLPWDPEYDSSEGESVDLGPGPHPLAECGGPSRFVLRSGRFFSTNP